MTEALKKMVEAMIAEAKRQDDESARQLENMPWLNDEVVATPYAYNWNEVARAGLQALDDLPDEIGLALTQLPGGYRAGSHSARDIWRAQLAEILKA